MRQKETTGAPGALGPEARKRLGVPAFEKRRDGEQLGRRDHALAAAPVDANLKHLTFPVEDAAFDRERPVCALI